MFRRGRSFPYPAGLRFRTALTLHGAGSLNLSMAWNGNGQAAERIAMTCPAGCASDLTRNLDFHWFSRHSPCHGW